MLGIDLYAGSIKLGDLFGDGTPKGRNYWVPVYDPHSSDITHPKSGYQREAKKVRVDQVMQRIISPIPGLSTPNNEPFIDNVNLNLRFKEAVYLKPLDKDQTDYGDFFVFEYISKLGQFNVLDGQTRIKGAELAWREPIDKNDMQLAREISETRVSITLSFCPDIFKEAYIFYLINQYSKVIPPDGATRLLFEGVKKNKIEFINEVTRANKESLIESMGVAERLSQNSSVWAGNIKDFNESGGGKMSIKAVAKIIEPLYKLVKKEKLGSKKVEDVVYDITEAYWSGLKLAYPVMFNAGTSSKYNILKAGPSEIMMKVLVKIYDIHKEHPAKVKSLIDKKAFKSLMKGTLDKHEDTDNNNNKIRGDKLFLSGENGAMGRYSNNAAKEEARKAIATTLLGHIGLITP